MWYVKEGIIDLKYKRKLNLFKEIQLKWINKLKEVIKNHKIITIAIIAFIMFSTLNLVMIYNFMKILQTIWNKIIIMLVNSIISKNPWNL